MMKLSEQRGNMLHGVLLIALFSCAAFYISDFSVMKHLSFSPLIIGIILGMLYANSLRNIAIVASGDKYIVVAVRSELEAKEINEMQLTQGFEDFMEQVLGKAKKIFAIDHIQQTRVLEEFKERMIQGTLPEPVDVIISRSNSSDKEKKLSEEEQMIELFPNIEIVND